MLGIVLTALHSLGWTSDATPASLSAIEHELDDNPVSMLRLAEQDLSTPEVDPERAWQAHLRLLAASATLEQTERVIKQIAAVRALVEQRQDAAADCLIDMVQVAVDRATQGAGAAEVAVEQAIERARGADQPWCVARLYLMLGRMHGNDGRLSKALAATQEALLGFESPSERGLKVAAMAELGWSYRRDSDNLENVERGLNLTREAIALLVPSKQRYLAATTHHHLAAGLYNAGRLEEALEQARQAKGFAEAIGDRLTEAYLLRVVGRIELDRRHPTEALAAFTRAEGLFAAAGVLEMVPWTAVGRAEALSAVGRTADARRHLNTAEPLRVRHASPDLDVEFERAHLRIAVGSRDADAASSAALAYAAALDARERVRNRRVAAEARERFETARTEAENRLLRTEQAAAQARLTWLTLTAALTLMLVLGLTLHLIQQRRLRLRLKVQAEIDELTGLPNRRTILAIAANAAAGRRASDQPACVAMLDIDHFKRVNDRFGHQVGDAALVTFASVCRKVLRAHDTVGRLGGEEFLMVLTPMQMREAPALFERLRTQLHATPVDGMPAEERLSCSGGFAELPLGASVEETLRRADDALYRAKAAGRDRLALAGADDCQVPHPEEDQEDLADCPHLG